MTELPNPMSAERLARLQETSKSGRWTAGDAVHAISELLAALAYQTARADAAEIERDEILRAAANIGESGLSDGDGLFESHSTAGAMFRSGVSMCVSAVRLHPQAETGLSCDVDVDGRLMEVVAQWRDAPVRTNWVVMAGDMFAAIKKAETERDEARRLAEQWRATVAAQPAHGDHRFSWEGNDD